MYLLARASVARRLVREHQIDGPLALSLTVEPTPRTLELEQRVTAATLNFRVYSCRGDA
jgi:hypothetical protein